MTDTRPAYRREEFEAALADVQPRWWHTGEDFIHTGAVMRVDGWREFGSSGNRSLTEPQRVLMMWSNVVGQTQNGGFTQFVENYEYALKLAHPLIKQLDWREMWQRFDAAFREQAGDPADPRLRPLPAYYAGPDAPEWPARRERIKRDLVDAQAPLWRPDLRLQWKRLLSRTSDIELHDIYVRAVERGRVMPFDRPDGYFESLPHQAADAFNDWLFDSDTKAASWRWIGDYIRRNRDEIVRLTD